MRTVGTLRADGVERVECFGLNDTGQRVGALL